AGLATIYAWKGNTAKAESLFKKLIDKEPDNMTHRLNLAFLYYLSGRKDDALKTTDLVISKIPRYSRAHLLRAVMLEQNNDLPEAISSYKTAAELAETSRDLEIASRSYFALAVLYEKCYLFFDAVSQLEKIIKMRPDFAEGYLELGRLCLRIGLLDKTVSAMNSLISRTSNVPQAYVLLGIAYFRKGEFEKSLDNLRKAKAAGVDMPDGLLAAVERKLKKIDSNKDGKDEKGT
ncbi:MAG: tetratricopeptide repeat protein, partial [Candidatus Omnitrophica bacterium]|nr:tetratricopeptide repeat protein [Candidatus Omnitrophota bacterium]